MRRPARWGLWARRTLLAVVAALLFFCLGPAAEALAQSTGGSFGGGSFGGGGGGGGSSGGSDFGGDGADLIELIVWILISRLPWPLKIGLIVVIGGVFLGYRVHKHNAKKRAEREDQDDHDHPDAP